MDINFKILKRDLKYVEVIGHEYESGYYSTQLTNEKDKFRYTDTVSLNLLVKVDSEENEVLIDSTICEHTVNDETPNLDYTLMEFDIDGLYRILHYIIPTVSWYNSYIDTYNSVPYNIVYLYEDGKFYKVLDNVLSEVDLEEIYELNITSEYPIYFDDIYTFTMSDLKQCLFNTIKPLIKELCNGCSKDADTFNRDFLWMAIYSILYLLDVSNFFEAQRLLESITGCNGVCPLISKKSSKSSCGCNENI